MSLPAVSTAGAVFPYLIGAALSYAAGRRAGWVAPVVCVLALLSAAVVLAVVLSGGTLEVAVAGWEPPLGIRWRADALSAVLLVTTAAIGLGVSVYAGRFFPAEGEAVLANHFQPMLLFLLAALNALFLSGDVFNLYVTLELSGLAAVALVAVEGRRQVLRAAQRYLFVALASATTFLLGVALLYGRTGTLDLQILADRLGDGPVPALALALMTVGLMGKTALFPLHGWLPAAHGSAPPPSSALLSGLVVKGSYYILLRLWLTVFDSLAGSGALPQILGALGAAAILWGGLQALRQKRLKLILAYSTIAQLGYLLLAIPLVGAVAPWGPAAVGGITILLVSHAFAKGAMFLGVGVILLATGRDRMEAIHDAVHQRPMAVFALGAGGLTLAGLPPSGGFLAKWHLLWAAIGGGQWWWAVVLLTGSVLAMGYVLRILAPALRRREHGGEAFEPVPDRLEVVALVLALMSFAMGLGGRQVIAGVSAIAGGGGG